jgi:membrane protease subunit (stomatin/prohibitin family)
LNTQNLPILSSLQAWKHGFDSPFKAEVYFVSTRQITELKWGTPNPIMLRDADFGPIRLRAFGIYSLRVLNAQALLRQLVGTDGVFEADEIAELMRSIINTAFADMLGQAKLAALDLASHYQDLSDQLKQLVNERIDDEYGLEVSQIAIVNISLPPEVEKAIDTRSSMGVIGDLQRYQQFQMANAITAAAQNPGGGAASAMGIGLGFGMAGQMAQGFGAAAPPPPPPAGFHVAVDGQTSGPFSLSQLAVAAQQGQLTAASLVWTQGMTGWTPAGQVSSLAALFAAPPLPPPAPR